MPKPPRPVTDEERERLGWDPSEDEAVTRVDHNGRFAKGNKAAYRGRGKKKNWRKLQTHDATIQKKARAIATEYLERAMPSVVAHLTGAIEAGDINAINTAMRYGMGPKKPETFLPEGLMDDYVLLAPEDRITAASRLAMQGKISLEQCDQLQKMAQHEIDTTVTRQLRKLSRQITHNKLTPMEVIERIGEIQADYSELDGESSEVSDES